MVWSEPSEQPHHLEIALALALEPPARLYAVEIAVDVELEVQRRVVAWPPEVGWLRQLEAQLVEIKLLDERIDDANRIAILDPLIEAFRQQRQLPPIDPFDEPCHSDPRRFSRGIIAASDFSHDQGHEYACRPRRRDARQKYLTYRTGTLRRRMLLPRRCSAQR